MNSFYRFPHTPHLAWLGKGSPRDDKVLSPAEARDLLSSEVVVEEKVDGAGIGISIGPDGRLRAQSRGAYVQQPVRHTQFELLFAWIEERKSALETALFPDLMLFGEWCYAVHGVVYSALPDWFLLFDVRDRASGEFWSVERRAELATKLQLSLVPVLARGRFELAALVEMLGRSRLGDRPAEGLYIRREQAGRLTARAKLVRPDFLQGMEEHWSRAPRRTNSLARAQG